MDEVTEHVAQAAERARNAAPALAAADDETLDAVLAAIADRLETGAEALIATSREEVADAGGRLSPAVIARLRLDSARLAGMVEQVRALADLPPAPRVGGRQELD